MLGVAQRAPGKRRWRLHLRRRGYRKYISKCCRSNKVIRKDLGNKPLCGKILREDPAATGSPAAKTPALRLTKEQLAKETRDIDELREHFVLIEAGSSVPISC
ncbi:uncharacterized protein LOC116841286 isoform X2 [Odontomachus brunneus]|uniref:uncharacterized protein LOC116841286 isoform X2 n=1 Tax=Odontomachus brunneus TaxID=486640 RepID=UPI0013F255EE|nr:uncharacterized protein LOC116841286 isoform X2 [Odontomachus brunneus]